MLIKTDDKYYKEIMNKIGNKSRESVVCFLSEIPEAINNIKTVYELPDGDLKSYRNFHIKVRASGDPIDFKKFEQQKPYFMNGEINFLKDPCNLGLPLNGQVEEEATVFYLKEITKFLGNSYFIFNIYSKNGGGVFAPINNGTIDGNNLIINQNDGIFANCYDIKIDLTYLDTSNMTSMKYMFYNCQAKSISGMQNFNTSNVTDMSQMFSKSTLKTFDTSNFDTFKVTDMSYMFADCKQLQYLDLSNFDTSNVTYMGGMFQGCKQLQYLNISNFSFDSIPENQGAFFMFSEIDPKATIILPPETCGWHKEGQAMVRNGESV